jgi:putative aminopeptidase FrvX
MVQMPDSRVRSFFGNIGDHLGGGSRRKRRNKKDKFEDSPTSRLGVDDDFNARKAGSEIGSWDNFAEDDDEWNGGAFGSGSLDGDLQAMDTLSQELLDKEVWLVALGAHSSAHAGIKALLKEHAHDLRNALFINIDSVGAGDLCFTIAEGTFRSVATDHRLQNLVASSANSLQVDVQPVRFKGFGTDASEALANKVRAISLIGLDRDYPVAWRSTDDRMDILDEAKLQATCDLVYDVIKAS